MTDGRRHFLKLLAGSFLMYGTGAMARDKDLVPEIARPVKPKPSAAAEAQVPVHASLLPVGPSMIRIGDPIRFRIRSNRSGFGHVYIVNSSGKTMLLAENLPLQANRLIEVPKAGLRLRASAPTGDNDVVFLATRDRFAGFAGGSTTSTPADIQTSGGGLAAQLETRLSATVRDRWALTHVTVRVTE